MRTACHRIATCLLAGIALFAWAGDDEPLRFVRVHVPHDALGQVDLGSDRYVPMSVREFEEAVALLQGRSDPSAGTPFPDTAPLLDVVHYEASYAAGSSVIEGNARWSLGVATATLPLGELAVRRARVETAAGTGDAMLHGQPDGSLAIAAPQPGRYVCDWRCGVEHPVEGRDVVDLSLVPALASVIRLRLPSGLRPVAASAVVSQDTGEPMDDRSEMWRIDVGPRTAIRIELVRMDTTRGTPKLTSWTTIGVFGRQVGLRMVLEPDVAWGSKVSAGVGEGEVFTLLKPPGMIVTAVRLHEPAAPLPDPRWTVTDDGGMLRLQVPAACLGRRQAFVIEAVAPFESAPDDVMPMLRVSDRSWAGGGVVVHVDPTQVVTDIRVEQGVVVTPEAAAGWRTLPTEMAASAGVEPSRIFIEQQGPQPIVRVAVRPRSAAMSVHRVTIAEVSPDVVLARATCDIRVRQGEAFELKGTLTKGWVVDAVEVVEAAVRPPLAVAPIDTVAEMPEWREVPGDRENRLSVAFASAITPARPVLLRITGHRGGMASGVPFTAADIDMVSFDGETSDAVLAVKTGAEMTIDTVGEPAPTVVEDPRLATLLEDSGIRVRLPGGARGADQVLRLARRRPPLDASTHVWLTSRDGRLVESFMFSCAPDRTEIDSIVVHFSSVMDDRLEWSLLPPAQGTLVARRIDPPERRGATGGEPIADTWLVEISPPARQPVTIRAACTVAFNGPMQVPLAWVEGATRHHGSVTIRESGRFRPRVVNHRLTELPPRDEATDQAFATVAEFSFDASRKDATDAQPAAEIIPGGGAAGEDARAWAWREETSIWCQASGATEYETRFDIENHGRSAVAFTVPQGVTLQGALIDGVLVPWAARGTGGGDVAIELPPGRRSIELVVRAMARTPGASGWWQVRTQGGALDVPVLEREVRVLLAPDVEIGWRSPTHRVVSDASPWMRDWPYRLFQASLRTAAGSAAAEPSTPDDAFGPSRRTGIPAVRDGTRGYRLVPVGGRRDGGSLLLVDRSLVRSVAIVAAAMALAAVCLAGSSARWLVPCLCVVSAVGALWVVPPLDVIFRSAWWGTLGGIALTSGVLGSLRRTPPAAWIAGLLLLSPVTAVADDSIDDLLRVFVTPLDNEGTGGETALVPEPLFRRLSRAAIRPADARVVSCLVKTGESLSADATDPWTMTIDVDADAGTSLVVDQRETGARILDVRVDGQPVPLRGDDPVTRVPLFVAGRHRVECRVAPVVIRRGQVDVATLAVPVAPRASLTVADPMAAMSACDMAVAGGHFLPATPASEKTPTAGRFDISRATAVRVVRPIDPRMRLAAGVRASASRNDLFWNLDACRIDARFTIDVPNEIVRSFIVRIDPGPAGEGGEETWRLEPVAGGAIDVMPLGRGRYLVERQAPEVGAFSSTLTFRRPLPTPVGVFAIPGIWIEGAVADSRLTQLIPAADLMVDVRLPDNAAATPREAESSLNSVAWRTETSPPMTSLDVGGLDLVRRPAGTGAITVRRRRVDLRATQRLTVEFAAERIGMELQTRVDGSGTPLVALTIDVPASSVIDRVDLFEERAIGLETGAPRRVDVSWSRIDPGHVRVVAQQPRTGRFRLDVAAHTPVEVSTRGAVAVMQVAVPDIVPMVVDWTSRDDRGLVVAGASAESIQRETSPLAGERLSKGTLELAAGETVLRYEFGDVPERSPAVTESRGFDGEVLPVQDRGNRSADERVEVADVSLVLDHRGRCWGSVRFDVSATSSPLRIAVPPRMRLFEVLVDGRQAGMFPRDDGSWEIPLLATDWPRSVLAVFAGDIGPGVHDGRPVEVDAPWVVGFPCRRVLWTIEAPDGLELRFADPARVLDVDELAAMRSAVFPGLDDAFARATEATAVPDRQRFEDFAAMRRNGMPLAAERPWIPAARAVTRGELFHAIVEMPNDEATNRRITMRVGRKTDPTAPHRAVATLLVVFVVGLAWGVSRRWPERWNQFRFRALPAVAAVAAVAWLILLDPAWPGWVMLAACTAWQVRRSIRRRPRSDSDERTITQFSPPTGGFADGMASTRYINVSPR